MPSWPSVAGEEPGRELLQLVERPSAARRRAAAAWSPPAPWAPPRSGAATWAWTVAVHVVVGHRRGRPGRPAAARSGPNTSPVSASRCSQVRRHPRQHDGGDHGRHQPEPDLAERERRRGAGDDDVAGGQQPDATGPRRAADDREDRLRRVPERGRAGRGTRARPGPAAAARPPRRGPSRSRTPGRCGRAPAPGRRRRPGRRRAPRAAGRASPATGRCGWRGSRG